MYTVALYSPFQFLRTTSKAAELPMEYCKQSRTFKKAFATMTAALYFLLLLCAANITPAASTAKIESTLELDALAEALGIPIHEDVGPKREKVPEFLQAVNDCWDSGTNDCLPEGTRDANVVRSFLGYENPSPPRAVQSYNHETELLNSLTITFNTTYKLRQPEVIRYALLRVHRRALTDEDITDLSQKCNFSHLELRLYTTLATNNKGEQVVVLKQRVSLNLTAEELSVSQWYSFNNFTELYKADVENPQSNKKQLVMVRLSIAEIPACPGISPSHLGFTSARGMEAELVGFSKNDFQSSPLSSRIINTLSAVYKRRRRQATKVKYEDGSGTLDTTDVNIDNVTNITTSKPEEKRTLLEMKAERCQLHTHTVSFADLGWSGQVLRPDSYSANFCAGGCSWPLDRHDNTTKHSYIQGLANNDNPDLIPPPCCVPKDLLPLQVTLQQSPYVVVTKYWDEMRATSCSCR